MNDLKKNDSVAVLDEDLEGKIVKIVDDEVVIETTEGFLLVFHPNELVKIEQSMSEIAPIINKGMDEVLQEKEFSKRKKRTVSLPKSKQLPPMEVDLHINKLVNSTRGMEPYSILNLQLETAERQLKFAVSKRIQRIVFIHGVGEGVLKAELDRLLSKFDNINYYDADYQKYGLGATEVYILQNA
ncbi:MAG TPA: Smr/MutS family protein [Salinimicrobium sp.]|nr:Smr/MutS family protein [Salinimicrobium sp.]